MRDIYGLNCKRKNIVLPSDAGVTLNPELKLLQYNLGQPLELDETNGYMPEKHGLYSPAVEFMLEIFC